MMPTEPVAWTALAVPQRVAQRLERTCELPFSFLPPPETTGDGAVVRLQTHGGEALGLALVDREAGVFRVLATAGDGAVLDDGWADARLESAWALRTAHGLTGGDRAFRLVNGAGDLVPGVFVDVYGAWTVVSALSAGLLPVARLLADRLIARARVRGAVVKHRARGRGPAAPVDLRGEPPPARLVVREGALAFEVHLTGGVNVGLFTDMRVERGRLAAIAAGRRVLNLFAYTGALSVAAAAGGAAHVTSVDLSEGVLAWARDHIALNGLDAARHTTCASDVGVFLQSAAARGERYDLVLVDPPSYSAARNAPFAIDRDYPPIIRAACDVLGPGGDLWLAANTRGYSLIGAVQAAVPAARRPRLVWQGGLPPDYPTEPADTEARYLQTALLRLL